jgi:nucleoside-diphosphate-sugar epimerase
LVAGAAGFVGSAVVKELSKARVKVCTTDRLDAPRSALPSYRAADLARREQIAPLLAGVDCVVNAAGIAHVFRPDDSANRRMHEVNGIAAGNLARAAAEAGVRHLVLVSSVSVYGSPGDALVDETYPCRPSGHYAESKLEGENLSREAVRGSATCLTILRPATIYGPGDRGNVARLIRAVDRGRFFWIGDGGNYKSLIYLDDFARACARAALSPAGSGVYNVSSPPETMRAVVGAIAGALKRGVPRMGVPAALAEGAAALAALSPIARHRFQSLGGSLRKWLAHDAYDAARFIRVFGDIAGVSLAEGMRREVEWYAAPR